MSLTSAFASIVSAVRSVRTPHPVEPSPLRERVAILLRGDAGHGFREPLTTRAHRARIVAAVRGVTSCSAHTVAAYSGLTPMPAHLPESASVAVVGVALLYREGPDAAGLILATACAKLLSDAHVPAVDSDAWLLAVELAHPGPVFGA